MFSLLCSQGFSAEYIRLESQGQFPLSLIWQLPNAQQAGEGAHAAQTRVKREKGIKRERNRMRNGAGTDPVM